MTNLYSDLAFSEMEARMLLQTPIINFLLAKKSSLIFDPVTFFLRGYGKYLPEPQIFNNKIVTTRSNKCLEKLSYI